MAEPQSFLICLTSDQLSEPGVGIPFKILPQNDELFSPYVDTNKIRFLGIKVKEMFTATLSFNQEK